MQLLDLFFGLAARGPRFFADGWGDRELCNSIDPLALSRVAAAGIEVRLGDPERAFGGLVREGTFDSPEHRLPQCSRRARVRLLVPEGELGTIVLHLAASGDQGFAMRLRFAAPLLADGMGALVLENPFYGERRPEGQVGPAVRSVSDLHLMAAATFQEGRSLLRWAREELGVERLGVTGFSMGGQMAAMVGASLPFPAAIVPIAASCSPDSVLRDGVLKNIAHWSALAGGADSKEARELLLAHLSRFSVTTLPPPVCPKAAIVVGTADDGVVPPSEMERIARHWGSELRWLQAGHISAVLRHQAAMREAIRDAFDRLDEACGRARVTPSGRARTRGRGFEPRARGARGFVAVRVPSARRAARRRS